jgi:hypothetical protein
MTECLWCGRPFAPRCGGSPQRYCSPSHRGEFHTAARVWTERALAAGALTIDELRNGDGRFRREVQHLQPAGATNDF